LEEQIRKRIDRVSEVRRKILAAADDTPYAVLQQRLDQADQELFWVHLAGNAVIAAFFSTGKPKQREEKRKAFRDQLEAAIKNMGKFELTKEIEAAIAGLRKGPKGITPFHWEIEFPEVFEVDAKGNVTGGFDVIIGNPPFAYKNTLLAAHAEGYLDWLQEIHEESHGNSDLVAHFFRLAFGLLRPAGCFGLIATKTIGQGDTRSTGLRWICAHGGTIFQARKRIMWPGQAAVVVSLVHIAKGQIPPPYLLDNKDVPIITSYLFHAGGHDNPAGLHANDGKSFIGSYVLGMGFTFDDTDTKGVATPLAVMEQLIEKDHRNAQRIFPFIGGEEVNDDPTHSHHRYVINFEDWPLRRDDLGARCSTADEERRKEWLQRGVVPLDYGGPVAADFKDLLDIVERKVKPERLAQKDAYGQRFWWRFLRTRPELKHAIVGFERVLVLSIVTKHLGFVFLPAGLVFSHRLQVVATESWAFFAVVQSSVHELWARFFSSTLEDRINYSPSDCFVTFPFPEEHETLTTLHQAGARLYEFRAGLLVKNNEGLTATYNRFHDPEEDNPDILRLRELHAAMNRAVLDAYGWTDIQPICEFLLDYEEEDEEDNGPRHRKKPWRYRWPDEIRDEILARLLDLNRQRALEEGQLPPETPNFGQPAQEEPKKKGRRKKAAMAQSQMPAGGLFSTEEGEL